MTFLELIFLKINIKKNIHDQNFFFTSGKFRRERKISNLSFIFHTFFHDGNINKMYDSNQSTLMLICFLPKYVILSPSLCITFSLDNLLSFSIFGKVWAFGPPQSMNSASSTNLIYTSTSWSCTGPIKLIFQNSHTF